MPILGIDTSVTGLVGIVPRIVYIATNDTEATVTAAGYLNHSVQNGFSFNTTDLALLNTTDAGTNWYQITHTGGNWTLVPDVNPGNVLLPVVVGRIATFTNVAGQIGDQAVTATHQGSIQAGSTTAQGSFIAFGAANAGANDKLTISYLTSGANRGLTITNAAMGQATTITMPDPGVAASSYILADSAGTQTIATGALAITQGILNVGSAGHVGTLSLLPTASGGANDKFVISALTTGGNFTSTIRNTTMGQSTVFTVPDPGVATTTFLLANNAGTQTIATGGLTVSNGSIAAGNSATPTAGTITSFPAASGGANDKLVLAAVTTGGNFTSTISNGTQGQTSTFTLPDPANAAARFLVGATATPFTANHSLVASGTGGLIADAGYQMKVVAQAAVAGGAAAQTVVDAFCTTASMVTASWNDTTNPVNIQTVAAGNGSFIVTSSADPGASHLNYIITKV